MVKVESRKKEQEGILLSIVIPTRKRPESFEIVLNSILRYFKTRSNNEIQIFVSNNGSDAKTRQIYEKLNTDYLANDVVYLSPETEFETAEEHLLWLYKQTWGKYVWFLGDQDIPTESGLTSLIEKLSLEEYDFYLTNFATERNNTIVSSSYYGQVLDKDMELNFQEAVQKFGYWAGICGISNQVLKSEKLNPDLLETLISDCGPIYSHMTHHIAIFGNLSGVIMEQPLVEYHLNDLADGNTESWSDYGKLKFRPYWDPWILGFLKQIDFLYQNNYISDGFLDSIIDYEVGLIPIPEVVPLSTRIKFNLECYLYRSQNLPSRQKYSDSELETIFRYCKKYMPSLKESWEKYEVEGVKNPPLHYTYHAFDQYLIDEFDLFSIYRIGNTYFGIYKPLRDFLRYAIPNPFYLCKKHFMQSTLLEDLTAALQTSVGSSKCDCNIEKFKRTPYARLPIWAIRYLLPVYQKLPLQLRKLIRNLFV